MDLTKMFSYPIDSALNTPKCRLNLTMFGNFDELASHFCNLLCRIIKLEKSIDVNFLHRNYENYIPRMDCKM